MKTSNKLLIPLILLFLFNCSPPQNNNGQSDLDSDSDSDGDSDSDMDIQSDINYDNISQDNLNLNDNQLIDGTGEYDIGNIDGGDCPNPPRCNNPINDGCRSEEQPLSNGIDDNCNGVVDEGINCNPGDVQPCFLGPPGRRGVGLCEDGHQVCEISEEFGFWGPCEGGIWPTTEVCDNADNDCDGCLEEDLCCDATLNCPSPGDPRVPETTPFSNYQLKGTDFFTGQAQSWRWTVVGTPCDQYLLATSNSQTFDISGQNTDTLSLFFRLSGDYTVKMTVLDQNGITYECIFLVHVKGPGLRVELCWDTTGSVDLDLHLHRSGTTTPWFGDGEKNNPVINRDDCYYYDCAGDSSLMYEVDLPNWGYPNTALSNCENGPKGLNWKLHGSCNNPRLDIDNVVDRGKPENINIDNPGEGDKFRVMIHYYGGDEETHPMVNIYCGGYLVGTYGADPDVVPNFNNGDGWGAGQMWRVVDVTTHPNSSDFYDVDCDLEPLRDPQNPNAYWLTNDDRSY